MSTPLVILIAIIVVIITIVSVLAWMKSQAKSINDYFCNAIKVYAFTGSQDARIAALAAAKVAAGAQRNSMLAYLHGMVSDLEKMSDGEPEFKPFADRFFETAANLEKEISVKDWTISDIRG